MNNLSTTNSDIRGRFPEDRRQNNQYAQMVRQSPFHLIESSGLYLIKFNGGKN